MLPIPALLRSIRNRKERAMRNIAYLKWECAGLLIRITDKKDKRIETWQEAYRNRERSVDPRVLDGSQETRCRRHTIDKNLREIYVNFDSCMLMIMMMLKGLPIVELEQSSMKKSSEKYLTNCKNINFLGVAVHKNYGWGTKVLKRLKMIYRITFMIEMESAAVKDILMWLDS